MFQGNFIQVFIEFYDKQSKSLITLYLSIDKEVRK